jgi:hypothetical protein
VLFFLSYWLLAELGRDVNMWYVWTLDISFAFGCGLVPPIYHSAIRAYQYKVCMVFVQQLFLPFEFLNRLTMWLYKVNTAPVIKREWSRSFFRNARWSMPRWPEMKYESVFKNQNVLVSKHAHIITKYVFLTDFLSVTYYLPASWTSVGQFRSNHLGSHTPPCATRIGV